MALPWGAHCYFMSSLNQILFCVWGFPEPTQTFIHRELLQMEERGCRVAILASHRLEYPNASERLEAIAERAIYLGSPFRWITRGIACALRRPGAVARTLDKIARLPHRTRWHRLRALGLVFAAASVADRVERGGYRYLHAHFAHHAELVMALAEILGLPWGATMHAVGIWRENNLIQEKLRDAQLVMTCTGANRSELLRQGPNYEAKVHLVHHGVQPSLFQRPTQAPSQCDTFIAVGRLVEKKGYSLLLRAWKQIEGLQCRLLIVGQGPLRQELEAEAELLELGERVQFLGALPNTETLSLIAGSRALIQPSVRTRTGDQDGIPNVIVEAFALGRPVIASRISGIPEVVFDGATGLLVDSGDVSGLAQAIARLSASSQLVDEMGRQARELGASKFNLARNVELQLRLLEEVVPAGLAAQ